MGLQGPQRGNWTYGERRMAGSFLKERVGARLSAPEAMRGLYTVEKDVGSEC